MGQFLPLGLGPVLVFGACTADATVRISQSHSLNGDIGPSHAEVASDHVGFGSGRGNLRPSLGGGIPEEDPIGSELQGSVRIGALRFSCEAAASPFVFDLPARNFASAVLEASLEDSLTLGGVPFGSSLRVGYSYFTQGFLSTSCSGESNERVTCASTSWELVARFGSDRLTLTGAQSRTADGRVSSTGSVDCVAGVSPYGLFTREVGVTAGTPVSSAGLAAYSRSMSGAELPSQARS